LRAEDDSQWRPAVAPRITDSNAPTGQLTTDQHPWLQLRPRPAVHTNLPTATAFAATCQNRAAGGVEVGLGEIERLADPQPGPPQDHDQRPQPGAIGTITRRAHHRDDLLHGRRIGGMAPAFVPGCATLVKARHRDRRTRMTGSVIQNGMHVALLTGDDATA
jgi:hypothetical protein